MTCTSSEQVAAAVAAPASPCTPLSQVHDLLVSLLLWWPYAPHQQCPSILLCGPAANGKSHLLRRVVADANANSQNHASSPELAACEAGRRVLAVAPRLAAAVALQNAKDGSTGLRRLLRRVVQEACTAASATEKASKDTTAPQLSVLVVLDHVECYLEHDDSYLSGGKGDGDARGASSPAATADTAAATQAPINTPYPSLLADLYTILRSAPPLFTPHECAELRLSTVVYVSLFTGDVDAVLPIVRQRYVDFTLALPTPTEAERRRFFLSYTHSAESSARSSAMLLPEPLTTALALRTGGVSYGGLQEIVSLAVDYCVEGGLVGTSSSSQTSTAGVGRGNEKDSLSSPSAHEPPQQQQQQSRLAMDAAAQRILHTYQTSNSVTALEYRRSAGYVDVQETRWEDIAGMAALKETLRRLVADPIRHRDVYRRHRVRPSTGVLLYGPPGTGKTMLAKAMATELNASFVYMDLPELVQSEVGESEKRLQAYFDVARERSPSVVFMDEVQAAFGLRYGDTNALHGRSGAAAAVAATTTSHDARLVSHLLRLLDAAQQDEEHFVLFVGATNVIHLLDPLLLRAGRLDTLLEVPLPDVEARESLVRRVVCGEWSQWFSNVQHSGVGETNTESSRSSDTLEHTAPIQRALVAEFVRLSNGFSGAQVRNFLSVFGLQLARTVSRKLDADHENAEDEKEDEWAAKGGFADDAEASTFFSTKRAREVQRRKLQDAILRFLAGGSNGDTALLSDGALQLIQTAHSKSQT